MEPIKLTDEMRAAMMPEAVAEYDRWYAGECQRQRESLQAKHDAERAVAAEADFRAMRFTKCERFAIGAFSDGQVRLFESRIKSGDETRILQARVMLAEKIDALVKAGVFKADDPDAHLSAEQQQAQETEREALPAPVLPNHPPSLVPTDLEKNGSNKYAATVSQVTAALRFGNLPVKFAYDSFAQDVVVRDSTGQRVLTDEDYTLCAIGLEEAGFAAVPRDNVRQAVRLIAKENTFDSALQWLDSIEWDGKQRVAGMMQNYFGAVIDPERAAADTAWAQAVGLYAMSAAAGRIIAPGCQADSAVILFSKEQGLRKTSGIRALVPNPDLYGTVDLEHRDADLARKSKGRLVVDCGELKGLHPKTLRGIKCWMTETHDGWVPKYVENCLNAPRRFTVWGTTNDDDFLIDPTGERRWLPIRVGQVDIEALRRDRDQLWAEGAYLFRNALPDPNYGDKPANEVCWRAAQKMNAVQTRQFVAYDELSGLVEAGIERMRERHGADFNAFTLPDLLHAMSTQGGPQIDGIQLDLRTMPRSEMNRYGQILRSLGYRSAAHRLKYGPAKSQVTRAWRRDGLGLTDPT